MRVKLLLVLSLLCLGTGAAADPAVHEYRLDNGLRLFVKEDHRAPVVVSQVWYKVGSSYEHDGITGISHVLEHMMFKGTTQYPPGEFSRLIARHGGQENAFTSRDYTAYFERLEQSQLAISFALEADRMQHLLLSEEAFVTEIQVVQEERRLRTVDQPQALTHERFNAVAFLHHPYRQPVIGWMSDLESLTVDTVREWYQRWYAPNNAIVVVVGDVKPEAVRALATEHFGPVPARHITPPPPRREPPHNGMRRVTVRVPAEVPYVVLGYKVPVLKTAADPAEAYALEVLSGLLAGGESTRLPRELVRSSQVAASATTSYDLYARLDSLFVVAGIPAQGHTSAELERALLEQLWRLRAAPVSAEELERIKAQVVASSVYKKDSMFSQAMEIGSLESVGLGWRHAEAYVERVRAVTAEQVQQAARKYLVAERLTAAVLQPLPVEEWHQQSPEAAPPPHFDLRQRGS
jgi:zinc protease